MWEKSGIIRNEKGLNEAKKFIEKYIYNFEAVKINRENSIPSLFELRNMLITSHLVVMSALKRKESRGSHYRSDFSSEDKKWRKNIVVTKNKMLPKEL